MSTPTEQITLLTLDQLHGGDNVRRQMDTNNLNMLARSIAASGIHEPLIVRKNDDGYEIVAGHRRYAAAQIAEVDTVPVIIRDIDDEGVDEIMLVENLQREDLVPSDEALGYGRLKDRGWTVKDIADKIGRSQAHVAARLRLLHLPREWQQEVDEGILSLEKADELAKVITSKEFRELSGLLEEYAEQNDDPDVATAQFEEDLDDVEQELRSTWNPERVLERLLSNAKRDRAIQRVREKVQAKGYDLIEQEYKGYGSGRWPRGVQTLESMEVDPKSHRKEDCHAFGVSASEAKAIELCTKPKRHQPGGDSEVRSPVLEEEAKERQRREEEREQMKINRQKRRDTIGALIATEHKELDELSLLHRASNIRTHEFEFVADVLGFPPKDEDQSAHDQFEAYVTQSKANARRALYALMFHDLDGYSSRSIGDWRGRLSTLVDETTTE